jgi:phosphoribosyl-ATP pyrophosphohydrolase
MTLNDLYATILDRKQNPKPGSYTNSLFDDGLPRMAQKVGEDNARLVEEIADLTYHVLVLMAAKGLSPQDVMGELTRRHK